MVPRTVVSVFGHMDLARLMDVRGGGAQGMEGIIVAERS